MTTATATLSRKFQISIPKAVRDQQGWEAGQEFILMSKGKGVLLMPVPDINALASMTKDADPGGHRDRKDRF